ncbi:MAG TPA: DUF1398 family protein [Chitinophagales bacterium]|nr:DUF1398 family protein [Chitinophagales bacterium]
MFTAEQIKAVHAKVKTGADFPNYISEIKQLGVTHYETYLVDGHSNYHGKNGYEVVSGPKYDSITVADEVNANQLKADIADHQKGNSNYYEISRQVAGSGIVKWAVCMDSMTCTYFDKTGNKILVEQIPG